jgi:hypothetical protein
MNAFLTTRRRAAATALAAGALLVGGAGAAIAPAAAAPSNLFGSGTTGGQGFQGSLGGAGGLLGGFLGGGTSGTTALPGIGLFKALFAVLGAVQTQVPGIAAPIIAQAQTAGTITAAEATQLTSLVSAQHGIGMGLGTSQTTGAGAGKQGASGTAFTPPSAGELTVLHAVMAAVLAQLPTIAAPVLASEVTNGDLTQAEADMFTKIIAGISSMAAKPSTAASTIAGMTGGPTGGSLLSTLESKLAGIKKPAKKPAVKPAVKSTKHHHKKGGTTTRSSHSH